MSTTAARSGYASKFGGMWIDSPDFARLLARKVRSGAVPAHLEQPIRDFERDGVYVLRGAASEADLDRFEASISNAFRNGHDQLIAQGPADRTPLPVTAGMQRRQARVVDSFVVLPEALNLLSSPRLVEFLTVLFDEQPLLFQSLSFDMGSEQPIHQDTAYVVVDRPMELLACWIALEDVREGSGELRYILGSHRLGDFDFGNKKHWDSATDSPEVHERWVQWIHSESERRNLKTEKLLAKRGDILVWHADIAHGGSPITDASLTRKSLVGHYCPVSAQPFYMLHLPERTARYQRNGIGYSSSYYNLSELDEHRNRPRAKAAFKTIAKQALRKLTFQR